MCSSKQKSIESENDMEQNQVSPDGSSWLAELLSDPAVAAAHFLASLLEEPVRNESGCEEDHSYVAGLVC